MQTALDELDRGSEIAGYGPPYNNSTDGVQYLGPISLQKIAGVRIPVDTARDLVLTPLTAASGTSAPLRTALTQFNAASATKQATWEDAYGTALGKAKASGSILTVPACGCGPVRTMMASMLQLGQSGAMDGLLLTQGQFYQTDYTRVLLFMQNDAVDARATSFNLQGDQWGAMNETGNYPGQAWLWLFTMLYQIPPYTTAWAANADALAIATISLLTVLLALVPWIPGLRDLPRSLGVHRLIWRHYYREQRAATVVASNGRNA